MKTNSIFKQIFAVFLVICIICLAGCKRDDTNKNFQKANSNVNRIDNAYILITTVKKPSKDQFIHVFNTVNKCNYDLVHNIAIEQDHLDKTAKFGQNQEDFKTFNKKYQTLRAWLMYQKVYDIKTNTYYAAQANTQTMKFTKIKKY